MKITETTKLKLAVVYLNAEIERQRDRAKSAEAALAESWDEGYDAGAGGAHHELGHNPYRAETTA